MGFWINEWFKPFLMQEGRRNVVVLLPAKTRDCAKSHFSIENYYSKF